MSNDQQDHGGGWQSSAPSAGWYQDPWDSHRRRYWDGQQWTGDVSFEPPRNWGGQAEAGVAGQDPYAGQGGTQQLHAAGQQGGAQPQGWGGYQGQPQAPQWPSASQEQHPTQTGWGGWGQPPQGPVGPWAGGGPMWQHSPQAPAQPNRVHVAIVAVIAAIAVLAGIGIGSQINNSSTPSAASSNGGSNGAQGSGGFTDPFGGGANSGTGGTGGSTNLSAAQKALVAKVDKSVVDINTELSYQSGAAAGTGMVLTGNGAILTNNHVIDGATSISVTLVSTGKVYKATVVGTDVTDDVAVLQLQDASGLTPIAIGNSSDVARGDTVLAIGNAGGAGGTPSAVTGTVRALNQTITASDSNGANAEVLNGLIQTDAPIQAGDSGGPLVNNKGQVIGMDTAASSSNQVNGAASVGFAIPMANATTIAAQIQQGKSSDKIHIGETGFLGVKVLSSSSGSGLGGGLGSGGSTTPGAAVSAVVPNSPAESAGLAQGDTITGVDGTPITSATSLTATLRVHHPGDKVSITWVDVSGQSHTATVTLAVGPAA
ncbi:trypsin-like peptidase domain-containing protein [Acidiferrimicrobium sp. IK]|uniref:trypsin-like peptidase domain-containing protein n=1 Tax=Acidiferrimicrobium sp. IK TaxID=2871700 RepID=UPI0021CAE7FC|nr:trypsin-like peptidase domain-containing protein [Acidiferrimicrobium sp. IK]MCU4185311.1 trypsin-like peptidase domain-containing protein [Acidiferrimicrobium sp. IK]